MTPTSSTRYLTERDLAALVAMHALAGHFSMKPDYMARVSYEIADAMIEESQRADAAQAAPVKPSGQFQG
ncbi:MAG: hypothetical protein E6Q97_35290 [Desulfurellales bacterium]|nr:MAG: hypothetical protein E6Q97_35290 [Desulfurellales bacterium]